VLNHNGIFSCLLVTKVTNMTKRCKIDGSCLPMDLVKRIRREATDLCEVQHWRGRFDEVMDSLMLARDIAGYFSLHIDCYGILRWLNYTWEGVQREEMFREAIEEDRLIGVDDGYPYPLPFFPPN
jgi:hypothetical protein